MRKALSAQRTIVPLPSSRSTINGRPAAAYQTRQPASGWRAKATLPFHARTRGSPAGAPGWRSARVSGRDVVTRGRSAPHFFAAADASGGGRLGATAASRAKAIKARPAGGDGPIDRVHRLRVQGLPVRPAQAREHEQARRRGRERGQRAEIPPDGMARQAGQSVGQGLDSLGIGAEGRIGRVEFAAAKPALPDRGDPHDQPDPEHQDSQDGHRAPHAAAPPSSSASQCHHLGLFDRRTAVPGGLELRAPAGKALHEFHPGGRPAAQFPLVVEVGLRAREPDEIPRRQLREGGQIGRPQGQAPLAPADLLPGQPEPAGGGQPRGASVPSAARSGCVGHRHGGIIAREARRPLICRETSTARAMIPTAATAGSKDRGAGGPSPPGRSVRRRSPC